MKNLKFKEYKKVLAVLRDCEIMLDSLSVYAHGAPNMGVRKGDSSFRYTKSEIARLAARNKKIQDMVFDAMMA